MKILDRQIHLIAYRLHSPSRTNLHSNGFVVCQNNEWNNTTRNNLYIISSRKINRINTFFRHHLKSFTGILKFYQLMISVVSKCKFPSIPPLCSHVATSSEYLFLMTAHRNYIEIKN